MPAVLISARPPAPQTVATSPPANAPSPFDIIAFVPPTVLQEAVRRHGEAFVQGAWRRVVDGIPEGYKPIPYPKFQRHRLTGEDRIVQNEAEHHALFESDPNWELPPGSDGLLALFFKECG